MKDEYLADHREAPSFIPHSSSLILEQLEQANLFLVRLDEARPWYRYHHLFRDFLRRRIDRDLPGRRAALHQRAARWYAAEGEMALAVNHALAGGNMAYAADLIVQVAWEQFSARGEIASILGWADRFPEAELAASPLLSLSFGQAAFAAEQAATAARYFALAEQGLARVAVADPATTATHLKLMLYQSVVIAMDGAIIRAMALLDKVEGLLPRPEDDPGMVAGHALGKGICAILRGDLPAAYAALDRMEQLARRANHLHFVVEATHLLARADLLAGQLAHAERRCTDLLARFGGTLPSIPALGLVLARLGEVAYQRGQLSQAEQLLRQGAQHGRRSSGMGARQIWHGLVRVLAARGDHIGLRALLTEPEGQSGPASGAVLNSATLAARADGLLALGATDEAWQWALRCAAVAGDHLREQETITITRVLLAQRRPAEALGRLESLIAATEAGGRTGYLIEGLALQAQALFDLERPVEARASLRRAHTLGDPAGYVQVFARMKSDPHPSPLILHPSVEPLTEREREVLRLIADGATNQDIANRLMVSVGTVKTHLNHILGKLDARNRTEAVARARAFGLL